MTEKEIERQFDKNFPHLIKPKNVSEYEHISIPVSDLKELKSFITKALQSQRDELVKEIEGMKQKVCGCDDEGFGYHTKNCNLMPYGYNQALQDIINKLNLNK